MAKSNRSTTQRYMFLVLTVPFEGTDAEFNRWYDEQHLPDVLDVPGFVGAQRFRIIESMSGGGAAIWRYAAIYEMECEDPQSVLKAMRQRIGTPQMQISATLDRSKSATFLLAPMSQATRDDGHDTSAGERPNRD